MPSDQNQEGVPNSMLEAMATGLPVAATTHGGIPETVTQERTGLHVPERDPEALAAALAEITADTATLSIRGRECGGDDGLCRGDGENCLEIGALNSEIRGSELCLSL